MRGDRLGDGKRQEEASGPAQEPLPRRARPHVERRRTRLNATMPTTRMATAIGSTMVGSRPLDGSGVGSGLAAGDVVGEAASEALGLALAEAGGLADAGGLAEAVGEALGLGLGDAGIAIVKAYVPSLDVTVLGCRRRPLDRVRPVPEGRQRHDDREAVRLHRSASPRATSAPASSLTTIELLEASSAAVKVAVRSDGSTVTVSSGPGLAVSSSAWPRATPASRSVRPRAAMTAARRRNTVDEPSTCVGTPRV